MCESVGKNNCYDPLLHASSDPITFNAAYFLDFRTLKFPLIFFLNLILFNINKPCILGFLIMKNNIRKPPGKFQDDLLYFQHLR